MENAVQFVKFSIVGLINTLITLLSYSILVYLGVNFVIANIIGYNAGMFNGYIWNSKWVFNKPNSNYDVIMRFIFVNLIVLTMNTLLLFFLINKIGINAYVSQFIIVGFGMIISFVLNRIWTFK